MTICSNCGYLRTTIKVYIIEARKPDGSLDFNNQTPFLYATEAVLFKYYFNQNKGPSSASWSDLHMYFNKQGWYIREKTW